MTHKGNLPGSVLGGSLLIAGSCIGAGMLALPIFTGLSGFVPSLFSLFIAWAFMTFTSLLLVEVNGWFYKEANLLSMSFKAFGNWGRAFCWVLYLFLFFSLLVAYITGSGSIFSALGKGLLEIEVPQRLWSLFFACAAFGLVYLGTQVVDFCNRVFVAGMVLSYGALILLGIFHIHPSFLLHFQLRYLLLPLPVLITSFGFQNVIPVLMGYMKGDVHRVRSAVFWGSLLALGTYIIWSLIVLGAVSPERIVEAYQKGEEATRTLQAVLQSRWVGVCADFFAFFAIATSLFAQGLGLVHFLRDGMAAKRLTLCLLAFLPPTFFSLLYPSLFFEALNFAGGGCAVLLFGALPIAMVWFGRYRSHYTSNYEVEGGKPALCLAFLFALAVFLHEFSHLFHVSA